MVKKIKQVQGSTCLPMRSTLRYGNVTSISVPGLASIEV